MSLRDRAALFNVGLQKYLSNAGRKQTNILSLGTESSGSDIKFWMPLENTLFNHLIDGRGLPSGRIVEIGGGTNSGKTTLVIEFIKACQRKGGMVFYADAEAKFAKDRAEVMGVDTEALFEYPMKEILSVEDAFDKIFLTVSSMLDDNMDLLAEYEGHPTLIVLDSLDAVVAKSVITGRATEKKKIKVVSEEEAIEAEEKAPDVKGLMSKPRVIKSAVFSVNKLLAMTNTTLVVINQKMSSPNPKVAREAKEAGGNAMRHADTLRLMLRKENQPELNEADGKALGYKVYVTTQKNHLNSDNRTVELILTPFGGFEEGYSLYNYLIDPKNYKADEVPVITAGGAGWKTIVFNEKTIKFKERTIKQMISENPGILEYMQQKAVEQYYKFYPKSAYFQLRDKENGVEEVKEQVVEEQTA